MCDLFNFNLNPSELCRIYWQLEALRVTSPLAFWIIVISGVSLVLSMLSALAGSPNQELTGSKRKPGPWEL
jgi:hypothetical protein